MRRSATELTSDIESIVDTFTGQMSVSAIDLTTGETVAVDSDRVLPTASVIKLPILIALLRAAENGEVDLGTRLTMRGDERVGGSGVLKLLEDGLQLTVEDAATLMIAVSDNTATNLVLDVLGGVEHVNAAMDELGLESIRLFNRIDFDIINEDASNLGLASTADLARLNVMIASDVAFSSFVSRKAEQILSTQQYLDQAVRYVLTNPFAAELGAHTDVSVASKTGFITGVRVDTGIVRFAAGGGFVYAISNRGSADTTFLPEAEGAVANGRVGRLLVEHWWPDDAGPAPLADSVHLPASH